MMATAHISVGVLMATYNGAEYLKEQLDSLLYQTIDTFDVLVRDDGSNDDTSSIVATYVVLFNGRLKQLTDSLSNLGPGRSFFHLLEHSPNHDYFLFCDQDDVWRHDKIEVLLDEIQAAEQTFGKDLPICVFADMAVTDAKLTETASSFWTLQRLATCDTEDWRRIAVSNPVTGANAIFNAAAAALLRQHRARSVMHDHALATLCAKYGRLIPLQKPLMRYRQHTANHEGARQFGGRYLYRQIPKFVRHSLPAYHQFWRELGLSLPAALAIKLLVTLSRFRNLKHHA